MPALLVFWVVACPLCREILPPLSRIARKHEREIRFVSINLDGKRFSNSIRKFILDMGIESPALLDDLRGDFFIASDPYGVGKTPTVVLIDAKGNVHSAWQAEKVRDLLNRFGEIVPALRKEAPGGKK